MGKQTVKIEKMNNNLFKISSLLIPNTNLTLEESGKIIEQFPPLLVNFNHRQCVECSSEFKRLQKWTKKNFKKYVENEKMKEKEKYETLNVPKNIKICISQDKDNIYIKSLKLPDIWLIVYLDKQKVEITSISFLTLTMKVLRDILKKKDSMNLLV